jgi:hypothetical protein
MESMVSLTTKEHFTVNVLCKYVPVEGFVPDTRRSIKSFYILFAAPVLEVRLNNFDIFVDLRK